MKRLMLGVVAALTLLTTLVSPARAEIHWIHDANDSPQEDISAVKVSYGPTNLFVRVQYYEHSPDYFAYAWIDTRGADTGPEFALGWAVYRPNRMSLTRVNNFGWGGEKERKCAGMDMTYDQKSGDLLFKVPRSCMKIDKVTPKGVRVSVQSEDDQFPPDDWAPEYRRFSPWIQPG